MKGWGQTASIAVYGDVDKKTVYRWYDQGLPHFRVGGVILARYVDVDRFIEEWEARQAGHAPNDEVEQKAGELKAEILEALRMK